MCSLVFSVCMVLFDGICIWIYDGLCSIGVLVNCIGEWLILLLFSCLILVCNGVVDGVLFCMICRGMM